MIMYKGCNKYIEKQKIHYSLHVNRLNDFYEELDFNEFHKLFKTHKWKYYNNRENKGWRHRIPTIEELQDNVDKMIVNISCGSIAMMKGHFYIERMGFDGYVLLVYSNNDNN